MLCILPTDKDFHNHWLHVASLCFWPVAEALTEIRWGWGGGWVEMRMAPHLRRKEVTERTFPPSFARHMHTKTVIYTLTSAGPPSRLCVCARWGCDTRRSVLLSLHIRGDSAVFCVMCTSQQQLQSWFHWGYGETSSRGTKPRHIHVTRGKSEFNQILTLDAATSHVCCTT